MHRRRAHRLATTLFVVLSLLCAQLVLASYACPGDGQPAARADMAAMGAPCDAADTAQPALCHAHGTATGQSFEAVKLPVLSLPLVIHVLELPPLADLLAAVAHVAADVPDTRPPPDPLFLSTLRLRV